MKQQVLGTANTHEEAWSIVCKDLEAMHHREPTRYPIVATYTRIEPKNSQHFEFSKETPFAIYAHPKEAYPDSAVAHAQNWRYNTEARSCFNYMPSYGRRYSWDSEDEAIATKRWQESQTQKKPLTKDTSL